jgi:ATP-binding cassette subfamily F protein uup
LLINTHNISKAYGAAPLFSDISFTIHTNECLGLIGPNGSGKTTLLKILAGIELPDSGKVSCNHAAHIVYLAQQDTFNPDATIKSILFGIESENLSEAECERKVWRVTNEKWLINWDQTIKTLSGGWRKRLAIVQALLKEPNLLLMDEPTNHLDLEGIIWLESVLKNTSFSYILISHDRYFLENTVNSIIELNKIYPDGYLKTAGTYTDFIQKREEYITCQIQKEQSLANKLRREEAWLQRMPKARTTKSQSRIDEAEQLKVDLKKISTCNSQNKKVIIDFDDTNRKTKNLLEACQLSITRNGKILFKELDLKLSPGMCLGLMGKNGSGKSTLINILNGAVSPDTGFIEKADGLRIVLFDQKREQLNQNQTLMQALAPFGDSIFYKGQNIHVAAWAKQFLFSYDQLQQPVSRLSGGEQARVLIANLMLQPADILLLDEPTNDLDIPTLEVLEENLKEFNGAIVLITHDRFLLSRLSNKLLYLNGEGKAEFFADYSQFEKLTVNSKISGDLIKDQDNAKKKEKLLSYEEQRELSRLPEKINKIELELKELQEKLHLNEVGQDLQAVMKLWEQIKTAQDKVNELYNRWEILEEKNSKE